MDLTALPQLSRDIRKASATLGTREARTLVDLYYQIQDFRIQTKNQTRALTESEEPHETVGYFHDQFYHLEKDIAKALDSYSAAQPLGEWARLHVGIGPVIAAGLLAHIDITRAPYPSAVWKFAGLAPGQRYEKGKVRDWNADLKLLCWKLGESFAKQSFRSNCYFGRLWIARRKIEDARNDSVSPANPTTPRAVCIGGQWLVGGNSASAALDLETKRITSADYKAKLLQGKLPDMQLDRRAKRYAVKRFLVYYWQAAWILHYGTVPPRAYVYEYLGHTHEEPCPVPLPPLSHAS